MVAAVVPPGAPTLTTLLKTAGDAYDARPGNTAASRWRDVSDIDPTDPDRVWNYDGDLTDEELDELVPRRLMTPCRPVAVTTAVLLSVRGRSRCAMRAEPRTRLGGVLLVAVLLAAACGGDDTTDEPDDDAATEAASEVAGSDDDRTATTTSEATDQPDATAEPSPEPEPQPEPVPLGDRFPLVRRDAIRAGPTGPSPSPI